MKSLLSNENPEILQRRMALMNAFFSVCMLGIGFITIAYQNYYVNIYESVAKNVVLICAPAFLLGIAIGRALLKTKYFSILLKINEWLFVIFFAMLLSLDKLFGLNQSDIFQSDKLQYARIAAIFAFVFAIAVKMCYMLRLFTQDYIDGKNGISAWIALMLVGFTAGMVAAGTGIALSLQSFWFSFIALPVIVFSFFLYGSIPVSEMYAKDEDEAEALSEITARDDVFVSYLNISFKQM
jgi:hypothetical protein